MLCLALAVAGLIAVQGFARSVDEALSREAQQLLMADISISSRQEISSDKLSSLDTILPAQSQWQLLIKANGMARAADRSQLVQVQLAEPVFPWYGAVSLRDGSGQTMAWSEVPPEGAAVMPELLNSLDVSVGDTITIANAEWQVVATIEDMPGIGIDGFQMAPTVLLPAVSTERSGMVQFGSRLRYHGLVQLPPTADPDQAVSIIKMPGNYLIGRGDNLLGNPDKKCASAAIAIKKNSCAKPIINWINFLACSPCLWCCCQVLASPR